MTTGKNIALTRWTFVSNVMSTQSFSSNEQVSFNFMAVVTARSDFGGQEKQICCCFHFSPSICHETMETVRDFILGGSKITADGDCSHEIQRYLLLGRKAMTNLDSILKSRDITLPNKGPSSQSYVFSSSHVWM